MTGYLFDTHTWLWVQQRATEEVSPGFFSEAEEWQRLYEATQATLHLWVDRMRAEADKKFPEKVTAFRPDMAAHGRFGLPCPRCGEKIQRIRYAE